MILILKVEDGRGSSFFGAGSSKNPHIFEESPIFEEVAPPRLPSDL